RFYRFFFLAPMFFAAVFFFRADLLWVVGTALLFALGTNFFPAFQFHYLAPITCLFVLIAVKGLERISRWKPEAAQILVLLCVAQFVFWYSMHALERHEFAQSAGAYETWSGINHPNPHGRKQVNEQLNEIPGKLLVFVRYSPRHIFQQEWVYN